ncbi:helicase domino isoform X2 [Lucilia sericata]|uniref:helicase domino isoform X2 n=1 Tax=Lucilia sericata TaxID=13632 RepID=UPI0018A81F3E|nr:helicase domino isoform X2 [Lucilia sericata]
MNEGESAGGGHQGSNPAPPAVPDRISSTTTTTTNIVTNSIKTTSNIANQSSGTTLTTTPVVASAPLQQQPQQQQPQVTSPIPRSFQQAFAQQHLQISDTLPLNTSSISSSASSSSLTSSPSAIIKTAKTGIQITSPSKGHMPQTPIRTTTDLTAATATNQNSATTTQPQQEHPQQLSSFPGSLAAINTDNTINSPLSKRKKLDEAHLQQLQENHTILSAAGISGVSSCSSNTSLVGSLLPTATSTLTSTSTSLISNSSSLASSSLTASLVTATVAGAAVVPTATTHDIQNLKKRILEQKYLRLRRLKEKHTENVAELFYLQTGGNMMDYPTWRKKAPTPQFITFSNAYRLEQLVNDERTAATTTTTATTATTGTPTSTPSTAAAAATAINVGATAVSLLPQHQQHLQSQQSIPVADNIATIIGVSGGGGGVSNISSGNNANHTTNTTQQTNTQSHPTTSLIQSSSSLAAVTSTSATTISSSSSSLTANTSLVSNYGRLPSSTTNKQHPSNATSSTVYSTSSSSSSTTSASSNASTPNIQQQTLTATDASGNPLPPQGAEIKIPAVGATPVAVSTKLPAAVQQLTQQGGTPLIPCSIAQGSTTLRRNGNGVVASSNTPPPLYSPTPSGLLVPAGSASAATAAAAAAAGSSAATTPNSNQEFSFKAKQEVDVMRRIMELQREGLWTEKRLPKQMEPPRPKAHWDYLLEEMVWLAADFAQERKWKKAAAKKCAKMVQKYFQDKANAAQKAEKAQELHLKRVAAFIAKEVKMFWGNVEKLVEYKHHTKIEEKRKKALDQHLSFIVDQTEKFSQQLAEGMNKTIKDASTNPSINSSRISSPKRDNTDDEFRPDSASEDDEETIAKAEEEDNADVDAEVAALEKESQMDLDDFLKDLPKGYLENRDKIVLEEDTTTTSSGAATSASKKDTDSDDGEFEANETSEDDENTISKQEEEEMDVDHQKEIDELEADNDLTVEELMAKYKSGQVDNDTKAASTSNRKIKKVVDFEDEDEVISRAMRDSDDDSTADEEDESDEEEVETDSEDEEEEDENTEETEENEQDAGLKSLLEDSSNANNSSKDDMIKDAAALAESLQPKGNTLSSTNVVTPVPFLLKHSLREYQHIGLDWLVTMNERKLNGILADEMGLGKTIQTIALLAHLACVKGNWGPHLIVVPSSVMLNWEMEFKKWCPGFKILTYYGSQKERKLKRVGWTKPNAFHVCITSYKLVVQDQQSFRRKKWKYLILDEAQNIKNFKSQRWQLLLNFSTERRLLLTGTPLQNDLMELWSLMHFLMPYVFSSHREFKEWFSNPMTGMIEGNMEYNEQLIQRLHKVIRPFLLRRLKKEVEKQMPKKYEHVVMCRLSNRQRYLYDDFMSRSKTRETLSTGNLLSVINVLMQLRKVCNHPNMFEVRPTLSPFQMEGISYETSRLICDLMEYDPFTQIDLHSLNLLLVELELTLTAYVSHKSRLLAAPRKLIEEIDTIPEPPPRCPTGKYKFHIRVRDVKVQQSINTHARQTVKVGASPAMRKEGNKFVPVNPALATMPAVGAGIGETTNSRIGKRINNVINPVGTPKLGPITPACITTRSRDVSMTDVTMGPTPAKQLKLQDTINGETLKTTVKTESTRDDKSLVAALAQQVKTNSSSRLNEEITVKTEPKDDIEDDTSSELDPIYNMSDILQQRKEQRLARLKLMANVNKRRTEATPIYGADCRESIEQCKEASNLLKYSSWQTRGLTNCSTAMARRHDNWTLNKMLKSYEQRCEDLKQIFQNFVIYVPSACAPRIRFYVNNLTSRRYLKEQQVESTIQREMSPKLTMLHPIISAMTTQFPDPRLIQYDCGKLQTMDRLLKQLKSGHHRVLIFTQMTKMLDVLEAFLNYHGHIYLRLDGATKVEQRQLLMERFNTDKRIFCFILSTRSGGVGINLTGADTVIFYDSDWNPTMDAQAQDRCHRIGQTRDVHIYRLVSEKTIEVNILKKANQKRMLSDMAIEGGNFTTSFFKSSTIKDLFNVETQQQMGDNNSNATTSTAAQQEAYDKPTTSTAALENPEVDLEKQSLKAFESALAAAEDEQDVQATKTAKAEVAADLAEFDENIPLDETTTAADTNVELSKADLEMQNLVKQLSPIERYAMRFVEETGAAWTAEQLRAAEAELEAQKREWEANRLAALQKEAELLKQEESAEEPLTYSRKDATNQIWISANTMEQMPMWCPPTPPQDNDDIYIDYSLSFMYDVEPIPESELPPVYVKKEYKRSRSEAGFMIDGNKRPAKIRREEMFCAPRSLFDRPSPAIAKIRRDLKNQRYRGQFKPNVQIPGLKPQMPQKPLTEPEGMAEWCIYEDIAILHVLVNLQGLPCNLMLLSPGHTPNWDLVAEIVNTYSKTFRSAKQCRWRYETTIQPREEGKLVESPKKQKKLKTTLKTEYLKSPLRCLRTTQNYANDNNATFTKIMRSRFDCIKTAYLKKAPPPKRHFNTPSSMNPKHMEVLQEFGIVNYDQPISPQNIAIMRANKLREKQRSQCPPPPPPAATQAPQVCQAGQQQQQPQTCGVTTANTVNIVQQQSNQTTSHLQELVQQQQQQQQQQQHSQQVQVATAPPGLHTQQLQIHQLSSSGGVGQQQSQQQTATAIVLQHAGNSGQQLQQQQTVVSGGVNQTNQQHLLRQHGTPTTTQIVKAIVAPQSGLLTTSQMQQLQQQTNNSQTNSGQTQHVQLQQQTSGGNLVATPASVSVVLTTPVQTISSTVTNQQQHHGNQVSSSTAQIVSLSPQQTIVSSSPQVGSIVQTQSLPQVVSVSQLATVGTVLTTSSGMQQPTATVTTLNTSALRAQRIVAASSGTTLQDVVLQQRSAGNPSPTIVSMSSLGTNVAPAQLQATQFQLASMPSGTQQVVTKGIRVSSLQQGQKIAAAAQAGNNQQGQPHTHIQLYRQRQQLKVLQAGAPGQQGQQTVVQTASGQTALVNAQGTIIQGSLMQTGSGPTTVQVVQGQKVAVATSNVAVTTPSATGVVTTVAASQVHQQQAQQTRAQFIKQVAAATGKHTITRQVGESDMLLVKRQMISAATQQKAAQVLQQGGQIFTTTTAQGIQLQQSSVSSAQTSTSVQQQGNTQQVVQQVTPQQIATLVKTSVATSVAGSGNQGITVNTGQQQTQNTVNMALSQLKPGGQIKVTMANQSQMRQLHMQQQQLAMPRKISRMTQIQAAQAANQQQQQQQQQQNTNITQSNNPQQQQGAQVTQKTSSAGGASSSNTGSVQTQLVHIQNTKSLPSSVTVQQIQQVMRQGQQGTLATAGFVLGKTSVGRVIPVSVASQPNQRQTIQVVSAASAQALAAGNLRAHVAGGQNIAGTIKIPTSGSQSQTQQAIITAIQQQAAAQQSQRQNASPVRLQTTAGGNLVAVVQQQSLQQQQQQQQQQNVVVSSSSGVSGNMNTSNVTQAEIMTITQTSAGATMTSSSGQQQQQQQGGTSQQSATQQVRTLVKKKIMQIRNENKD